MGDPTTPLPPSKSTGDRNDERSVLVGYLDYHRAVLARKAEGVSEEQARLAACPPSELTLLGLVRHMADVERFWFRNVLVREEIEPRYSGASHPDGDEDGDFHPPPGTTLAQALDDFWAEIEIADRNLAATTLDNEVEVAHQGGTSSVRRIIVHLIEEYARHCGHADLLREAIDGSVGD